MVKDKKATTGGLPRISLDAMPLRRKSLESLLLIQRMKELDREFARQTRQLAKLTKDLAKKLTDKL